MHINQEEFKNEIAHLHKLYYSGDFIKNPTDGLKFHRCLEYLFNLANIQTTLVARNPDKVSPEMFKAKFGIEE